MIVKIIHHTLGGHVHCSMFTAKAIFQTFAKCGDFVMRVDEFPLFKQQAQNFFYEERRDFEAYRKQSEG